MIFTDTETCYTEQKSNPTRMITRFIFADRVIHTDWNCAMQAYYQKSNIGGKIGMFTAGFKFKIK